MKNSLKLIALFSLVIAMVACDKVDDPIQEKGDNTGINWDERRTVLLMDFTGHNCIACPGGALEAQIIHDDYPENALIMAVHPTIDGLTTPLTNHPEGGFTTNWNTPEGENLQQKFNIPGALPVGVVSGIFENGAYYKPRTAWRPAVEELLEQDRIAEFDFTHTYNNNTRQLQLNLTTTFLAEVQDEIKLIVAVVESGMVDWQTNGTTIPADPAYPPGEIDNYVHKHVLRKHLNGIEGEVLTDTGALAGSSFTTNLLSSISVDYNEQNVEIYIYAFNASTQEIYHVESFHLMN